MSARCWGWTAAGHGAGACAKLGGSLMMPAPGAFRSTACLIPNATRSWRCSTSGGTSTGRIANSRTAVRIWAGCGCHHRRWTVFWQVTALLWPARPARPGQSRRRGRTGVSGDPTNCGASTEHSSRHVNPPSMSTRSSMSCRANGSPPISHRHRTRSLLGSCSPKHSKTKDCSPTRPPPASMTPTQSCPTATRSRCCWRSATTDRRCAQATPPDSWPCAR